MKKICVWLICLSILLGLSQASFAASDVQVEEEPTLVEISSWDEFADAFEGVDKYSGKSYIFKLTKDLYMEDKDIPEKQRYGVSATVYGCDITFDFNGHTLNCTATRDNIKDFIIIVLSCASSYEPVNLTFTDSGYMGGIFMDSTRDDKRNLSALYITENYVYTGTIPYMIIPPCNKVTFNGGAFHLESKAECNNYGWHTINKNLVATEEYYYRGAVVTDQVANVEVNDGVFVAKAKNDAAKSPLAAFATTNQNGSRQFGIIPVDFVINGGVFQSDSSAFRSFNVNIYNNKDYVMVPKINGGIFLGNLDFTKEYYYNDMTYLKETYISFPDRSQVYRDSGHGEVTNRWASHYDLLLNTESLVVLSDKFMDFKTKPTTKMYLYEYIQRPFDMTETFSVSYKNLHYLKFLWDDVVITPYIAVGLYEDDMAVYDGMTEMDICYNDYYTGGGTNSVYVEPGVRIEHSGKTYTVKMLYDVSITPPKPAKITAHPESVTVEPGEWAELTVFADYAREYCWYYYQDGTKIPLDQYKYMLFDEDEIEGETTDTLRVRLDSVAQGTFYCAVKGSDSTITNSRYAYVTWGGLPDVTVFEGGEYIEGDKATFHLKAKYADDVTWFVQYRNGSDFAIYTTAEFEAETGLRCEVRRNKLLKGNIYETYLHIFDATESVIRSYSVGYELKNRIGTVSFSPDNVLPFTKKIEKPEITQDVSAREICYEGENLSFSFKGTKLTDADWQFEKPDDDGYNIVYDIDELRAVFPESKFETTFVTDSNTGESIATLNITNARADLFNYTIYPYAINATGSYNMGSCEPLVLLVRENKILSRDTYYRNITVDCVDEGEYTLYIAGYDINGRLEELNMKTLDFARGRATYDMEENFGNHYDIKVMLWNDKYQPLCKFYQE